MLFDIATVFEGVKKSLEAVEGTNGTNEMAPTYDVNEFSEIQKEELDPTNMEAAPEINEVPYMADDIGLQQQTQEFGNPEYIQEVRSNYEKVDQVLSRAEQSLESDPSDLNYQRVAEGLERYKGTVFEHELKDSLKDQFEMVEDKQQLVTTEWGETKPDIILHGAQENMQIGGMEIQKGEDLYIEAKCGSPEYIRNEFGHILQQVEGHESNSLVVVSKDYLDLSPDVRAEFEKKLSEKGSHIYVADVSSTDVSAGLFSSLRV
jgi:hypothetical protein